MKGWKIFILLLLLALKLIQVSSNLREEVLSDYRTAKLGLLKAKIAITRKSIVERLYKKVKEANKRNCAFVFPESEPDSKITTLFQSFVNKYAEIYDVKVKQIVWGASQTEGYVKRFPFTLTLEGEPSNVRGFLCVLSGYRKLIFVDYFNLTAYSNYVTVDLSGELLKVGNNVCSGSSKKDIK